MPKYQVQIEARNFLVDLEGSVAKRGFFTFRYVEADDKNAAESSAVRMLRDDQELRELVKNDTSDPPIMDVIDITELKTFDGIENESGHI